jgi:hypothetical protein
MTHSLWNQAPLQTTYQWFASLQMLLETEKSWIKRLRYHADKGFYHARDASNQKYLLLDSQIQSNIPGRMESLMLEAMQQFDQLFEARWFRTSAMDPIFATSIPPGHAKGVTPAAATNSMQKYATYQDPPRDDRRATKRAKLGGKTTRNYDFVSSSPVMEIVALAPNKSVTATLMSRFLAPIPFPCLQDQNGTFNTICLNSAFQQPHNVCDSRICGDRHANPRIPRLHIDLAKEPWCSKPEQYWTPLVAFLTNDAIRPHVRPSQALKQLTPSTKWT